MEQRIDFSLLDANSIDISESQLQRIDKTIELVERDVSRVDDEIARLNLERDDHLGHLDRLRAAKSSVKRVPPEVLLKIFGSLLQENPYEPRTDDSTLLTIPYVKTYVPWIARQVCTKWRQLVLKENRLWNQIRLNVPPIGSPRWPKNPLTTWEHLLQRTQAIIPQSGPVYLTIEFLEERASSTDDMARIHLLIKHLQSSLGTRLKGLNLTCDTVGFAPYLNKQPGNLLGSLETLSFHHIRDEDRTLYNTDDAQRVTRARYLHTLRILGAHKLPFHQDFFRSLQWGQLREVTIEYPVSSRSPLDSLVHSLSGCQSLETAILRIFPREARKTARFDDDSSDQEDSDDSPWSSEGEFGLDPDASFRCTLPRLTRLCITTSWDYFEIFDHLTLPLLSFLCIQYPGYTDYASTLRDITSFLQRSMCKLRTFIENPDPSSAVGRPQGRSATDGFLDTIGPTIEELHTGIPMDNNLLQRIADGSLLPRLTAFKFCANTKPPYESLNILERRFGWLDPKIHKHIGLRKVRMVYRFGTTSNPLFTKDERSTAKRVRQQWEDKFKGLEIYIGPKRLASWTDASF